MKIDNEGGYKRYTPISTFAKSSLMWMGVMEFTNVLTHLNVTGAAGIEHSFGWDQLPAGPILAAIGFGTGAVIFETVGTALHNRNLRRK